MLRGSGTPLDPSASHIFTHWCGQMWTQLKDDTLYLMLFSFPLINFQHYLGETFLIVHIYFFLQINGLVPTSMLTENVCLLINAVLIALRIFLWDIEGLSIPEM